jgi:outer membrane receptor protein involved in Fe transport
MFLMSKSPKPKQLWIQGLLLIAAACIAVPVFGASGEPADTMLMFVGENLEVLSIASRREESAAQAPAVAHVVTRDAIINGGTFTLSQALARTPGFYMAPKEWGTRPYLRGIPDSVLFLHDTVPIMSDITKSVHPLDEELSLAGVKRIEIIRGPGSVLWGPDAFAGIVNVVPLTGKDFTGVETGIHYGMPGDSRGFFINNGHDGGNWDAFVSVSGRQGQTDDRTANVVSFWADGEGGPVDPTLRYGHARPRRPDYFELTGNASIGQHLAVSGRFADETRPYVMSEENNTLTWIERRSAPVNYLKIDGRTAAGPAGAFRFTGYYSSVDSTYRVIDLSFSPREQTAYGELIYDRDFLSGRGVLTSGAAYRNKRIENAPIWDAYLPDFLGAENTTFLPGITEQDYRSDLWSLFSQYTHKIGRADVSAGLRYDAHDAFSDRLSYNAGIVWSPSSRWVLKALYGTAYRTPFARQLLEEENTDLEKISTTSLKISWQPEQRYGMSVCGFSKRLSDHIMEDPYAGLSVPNSQKIRGVEIDGHVSPTSTLRLGANLTLLENSGPDETYRYVDSVFIRPDGTIEEHYAELRYDYDTGPKRMVNFSAQWDPADRLTLFLRTGYFSSISVLCPRCETTDTVPGVWLTDMKATLRDVGMAGLDLELFLWNVTDKDYRLPGTYSVIDGDAFSAMVMVKRRF